MDRAPAKRAAEELHGASGKSSPTSQDVLTPRSAGMKYLLIRATGGIRLTASSPVLVQQPAAARSGSLIVAVVSDIQIDIYLYLFLRWL